MSDDRSIERAARSWLELGPNRAPERPVELALERIQTTPQDRAWRSPALWRAWSLADRLSAAIAVIAVVAVGGILLGRIPSTEAPATSPSPSPISTVSPSPSIQPSASASFGAGAPPVLTATFASGRNGFSMVYPGDWQATPATARWEAGAVNLWGSAALDELRGATVRFAGTSQPLAPGQTVGEWLTAYAPGACLGSPSAWPTVMIGGVQGFIDADGCEVPGPPEGKGGRVFDAVVVTGGRAYAFTMDGELTLADFTAVLAAVSLDPASAIDDPTQ